jgi:thioesterase domain-containing protein
MDPNRRNASTVKRLSRYSRSDTRRGSVMKVPSTDARALILDRIVRRRRAPLGTISCAKAATSPELVQLRRGATDNPVYFIGIGLWELNVAGLICSDNSIFAIDVPWPSAWRVAALKNRTRALPTMEQLVAPYVSVLTAHAPLLPCIVAGFSFQGLMAFEAAHQVNRRGGKVRAVMLLDSRAKYPTQWEKFKQVWKGKANDASFFSMLEWMFVKALKVIRRNFNADTPTMVCDDLGEPLPWVLVERVYLNAAKKYSLECLDSHGVLFRSVPTDDRPAPAPDGGLGWNNLFRGGLEIIQTTGDHHAMVQSPHNLVLAREMSKVLNCMQASCLE